MLVLVICIYREVCDVQFPNYNLKSWELILNNYNSKIFSKRDENHSTVGLCSFIPAQDCGFIVNSNLVPLANK